jgi:hypothetical protein
MKRARWGALALVACAGSPDAAPAPRATIMAPADGAEFVAGDTVRIVLEVEHLTLAPAGTDQVGTGHHHLLVNRSLADSTSAIPADSGFVHLGQAQTEHVLTDLSPGRYEVIAVLGDYLHVPIPGQQRDTVTFVVR